MFQEFRKGAQEKKYKAKKVHLEGERLELRWLPSTAYFDSSTYSVNEVDRFIDLTVDRDTSGGTTSADYATRGTATAGPEYTVATGTRNM